LVGRNGYTKPSREEVKGSRQSLPSWTEGTAWQAMVEFLAKADF
jgi:hypothetical protein